MLAVSVSSLSQILPADESRQRTLARRGAPELSPQQAVRGKPEVVPRGRHSASWLLSTCLRAFGCPRPPGWKRQHGRLGRDPQLRCPEESSGNNSRLQAEGRQVQVTVTKTGLDCQRDPGSVYDRHRAHYTLNPWGCRSHWTGGEQTFTDSRSSLDAETREPSSATPSPAHFQNTRGSQPGRCLDAYLPLGFGRAAVGVGRAGPPQLVWPHQLPFCCSLRSSVCL